MWQKRSCPYILHKKNCSDLNLGGSLFPDSGLYLLNGFDLDLFLFWSIWSGVTPKTSNTVIRSRGSVHGASTHYFIILESIFNNSKNQCNIVSNFNFFLHILPIQNLVSLETHTVLLYFKSKPLYLINVNKKNVKIYKKCQNLRNNHYFTSALWQ